MKKFILFDNDGVLVDTEKYYFKANQKLFQSLGYELTLDTYKTISLKSGKSVLEFFKQHGYDEEQILELRDKRDKIYEEYIFHENLALPGVSEKLRELSKHFRMAIVTSTKRSYFSAIHEKTEFAKFFEFVVAREDYKIAKPNPQPYLMGIEKSGCSRNQIVVIEDTPRGLESAKAAGLDCVIVTNEYTADAEFIGASLVLNSIDQLEIENLMQLNSYQE